MTREVNSFHIDAMAHFDLLLYFALLTLAYTVLSRAFAKSHVASNIPWVGRDFSKVLSHQRATWASVFNTQKWLAEGYEKVRGV